MTSPAPPSSAARLDEIWKRVEAALGTDGPLPARVAQAAAIATGARDATLYLREKDAWVRTGETVPAPPPAGEIPDPLPEGIFVRDGNLWLPLSAEGELHGLLRLCDVPAGESPENTALLAFVLGAVVATHRLGRQVRDAEFELKARLLELESLYDLGLSLGGQLDLSALADEVLFRSISLTDAGKGTLVLFDDGGRILYERSVGGELLARDRFSSWRIPEGEALVNNEASTVPTAGERLSDCEKCLAVAIAVPGRRLGFLAVADKESR